MPPNQPPAADRTTGDAARGAALARLHLALAPAEQALVELLVLDPQPIRDALLLEALRLCAPEPAWSQASAAAELTRQHGRPWAPFGFDSRLIQAQIATITGDYALHIRQKLISDIIRNKKRITQISHE